MISISEIPYSRTPGYRKTFVGTAKAHMHTKDKGYLNLWLGIKSILKTRSPCSRIQCSLRIHGCHGVGPEVRNACYADH